MVMIQIMKIPIKNKSLYFAFLAYLAQLWAMDKLKMWNIDLYFWLVFLYLSFGV